MNKFTEYLRGCTNGKKVCILGFGREGKSTYRELAQNCSCKSITISDLNPVDREANNLPESVSIITGEGYQHSLGSFDIVFKSPGIVLEKSPEELDCEITSETQIFFSVFGSQTIGITGTKGKSTVSSLIYHILKESGKDTLFAGNIGIPVFDIAKDVTENTIIVCELSCHQLEYMTVSPHIAVFLNLYEEHLDHYGTMERYYAAKKNIYLHQNKSDILYCNSDIIPHNIASTEISISNANPDADVYVENEKIFDSDDGEYIIPSDKIKLLGVHNHYNIAVAWDVCRHFVTADEFTKALCSFNPLAHRLEFVDNIAGVRYYDDSISTACATAIEALKSVPNPGTILLGGMDRGIDYAPLVEFLSDFQVNIICMEASGKRIYDMIQSAESFKSPERSHYVAHLEEAVKLASEITKEGQSVLLSPAAASYGIFRNFEERGDIFKKLVADLK